MIKSKGQQCYETHTSHIADGVPNWPDLTDQQKQVWRRKASPPVVVSEALYMGWDNQLSYKRVNDLAIAYMDLIQKVEDLDPSLISHIKY